MTNRRIPRLPAVLLCVIPALATGQLASPRPSEDPNRAAIRKAAAPLSGSFSPRLIYSTPTAESQVQLSHKLGVGDRTPTHFQVQVGSASWRSWQPYTSEPLVPFNPSGSSGQKCDDPALIKFPVRMQLGIATVLNPATKLPVVQKHGSPLEGYVCMRIPG